MGPVVCLNKWNSDYTFNVKRLSIVSESELPLVKQTPGPSDVLCHNTSLAWPDRFFSHGAYRLEIISACCFEQALISNQ